MDWGQPKGSLDSLRSLGMTVVEGVGSSLG